MPAGIVVISNTYLAYNDRVKTEGQRNSIYTTLSLIVGFTGIEENRTLKLIFYRFIANPICKNFGYKLICREAFSGGFKLAFSATTLAIQLLEGKTKINFQSPIKFS